MKEAIYLQALLSAFVFSLVSSFTCPAFASSIYRDDIVSNAARIKKSGKDVPASLLVFAGEEIRNSKWSFQHGSRQAGDTFEVKTWI